VRESDLFPPVRKWLESKGYTIHVEMFDADIIATKDGRIVVVELKPCLTQHLITQCARRSQWADEVWCAIGSEPRTISELKYSGFGLLLVSGGKVRKKLGAKPQPWQWHKMRAYRAKRLMDRAPAMAHEIAGLPCCAALREQRERREAGVA
jgi:hypothetical protein